jgi:uncharacterized membrane protein
MHAECARSLLWINGGSAVALLTFLQANWSASPKLVPWIVVSLGVFAFGVLKATSIYGQLADSSLAHDRAATDRADYAQRHRRSGNIAWICFLIGCAIVGAGMILAAVGWT